MYIHNTDKYVGENTYVSLSSIYNPKLKKSAAEVRHVVRKAVPVLRKLLDFDEDVKFRIAPIKGKYSGRYCHSNRMVELDCRMKWDMALEVLCHELVHAEQFHTGKLDTTTDKYGRWVSVWHGNRHDNKGTTYNAYRNQPWEKEAFERQAELAKKVNEILEAEHA